MTSTSAFNLDVLLGESEPKPLTYKGREFALPAELPADCLVPFLQDDLGLIDLVAEFLAEDDDEKPAPSLEDGAPVEKDDDEGLGDMVMKVLQKRPTLPSGLLAATREAFHLLIEAEQEGQYEEFVALRPSVPAYMLIARGVLNEYGVSITDFFFSGGPSDDEEKDSKPTSPTTTGSTSEASGSAPVNPGS